MKHWIAYYYGGLPVWHLVAQRQYPQFLLILNLNTCILCVWDHIYIYKYIYMYVDIYIYKYEICSMRAAF